MGWTLKNFLRTLLLGASFFSTVAHADVYVFGGSTANVIGIQTLTINGSQTIQASDAGWYTDNGTHFADNDNYVVGTLNNHTYHDFFVFDLTTVSGPITSAELSLYVPSTVGYVNSNSSAITYQNWDVSTQLSLLTSNQTSATSIFSDLGTGTLFGTVTVGPEVQGQQVHVSLNGAALSAILAAEGGQFAIGGAAFAATSAVPEASTWAMLLLGFVGVSFVAYRRNSSMTVRIA